MTTPNKAQIVEKAIELFHNERARCRDPSFSITPTEQELKENGFWTVAVSELMRDQYRSQIETKDFFEENLESSGDLKLDVQEALANGIYTCGTRNTGKSDLNMMIADIMRSNDVIVSVFDPSMDWLKRSGIQKYLTVQSFTPTTIPTESMICDVSLLTLPEQKSYVERFNRALFEHQIQNGNQWHFCIFEEAHQYFPQGCLRSKNMQYSVRLLTQGRNFKISMAMITQFSSMIDKDVMKFMNQRFFGASNEPNDLRYLHSFLGKDVEQLKTLDNGNFLYFNKGKISKICIEAYESGIAKTQIVIPHSASIEPINCAHTQNTNLTLFLRFAMILCFTALLIRTLTL